MLAAVAALLSACSTQQPSETAGRISSLELKLIDPKPTALGTPAAPISTQRATFDLFAIDDQGGVFGGDVDVNVYISFGGVKTGKVSACGAGSTDPIATIHLTKGAATGNAVDLPQAFGATSIWLDENVSHATGASPTMYFRNPLVGDVQTPPDLMATNATFCTPFDGKFIIVDQATQGGQLVVTSVFGDSFVVTDTGAQIFNSMYLYSFGKPPSYIVPGKVLKSFSGNVSKFVGFTELNFPLFDATDDTVPLAPLPPPVVLSISSLANRDNVGLLKYDASVVTYTGKICDPMLNPSQWTKYNEFVIDGNNTCDSLTNYAVELPAKTLGTFDPLMTKGKTLTVVGMLRNNSGQNSVLDANGMEISCSAQVVCATGSCIDGVCKKGVYNFWTIYPRSQADITVQ
jgi:hypothetical protein